MCGAAIDVPLARVYVVSIGLLPGIVVPAARAAPMLTPGAAMSGFTARSPTRGPRLEKLASWSFRSTAATVSALSAVPGVPRLDADGPSLPDEITNSLPVSLVSSLTVCSTGSTPGVSGEPRLMLMTRAGVLRAAHSMPAITHDHWPVPSSPRTLPTTTLASLATPLYFPAEADPRPAMIDDT